MIKTVLTDTSGATAVLTALTLATVMGFVALGIESTTGLHQRLAMQDAADAAAFAGTLAFRAGSTGNPAMLANAMLAQNGYSAQAGDHITIRAPLIGNPDGRVDVHISRLRNARFGALLDDGGGRLEARAAAHLVETARGCVLGLAPGNAIDVRRKSDLRLDGCAILSAAEGLPPLRLAEADPYRDLSLPAASPCNTKGTIIRGATHARSGGKAFVFCGGLRIEPPGMLQLDPGVYAISGGPLIVHHGASLAGRGVSILLMAGASAHFAEGSAINLEAPATGPYAGLALIARNDAGASDLLAGASQRIVGTVHMPAQDLSFAGSASSPCTHIIASRVKIAGPTRLENACDGTGTKPLRDRIARLAQ